MHIYSKKQFDDHTIHLTLILMRNFYLFIETLNELLSYFNRNYYKQFKMKFLGKFTLFYELLILILYLLIVLLACLSSDWSGEEEGKADEGEKES